MSTLPATFGDIRVRYLQASDFESYADLEKNEEAMRFVGGPNPKSREQLLVNFRSYQPTTDLMAIVETATDSYIGRCGFLDANSGRAEFHIVIDPKYWRRGIAERVVPLLVTLALDQDKTPISVVDPRNEKSIGLLGKLGWIRSGTKRSDNYEDGFYVYRYGI